MGLMTVETESRPLLAPARTATTPARPRAERRDLPPLLALLAEGVAFVVLLLDGGSATGRIARIALATTLTAVAIAAAARGGRRASFVLVAAGIAGVAAGAGIGVMHVVKHDVSSAAFAALVALPTGLALFAAGVVALTRSTHGRRRLLAIPGVYVVLQFLVLPLTIAVYGTNAPRTVLDRVTPADRGLTFVDAGFTTSDGVHLSGWYLPSHNGAAAVLLHGSGETRTSVLDHAVVLARAGFGVLMFDARGHGRSGGDANEFGWYGDRDARAAVNYLARRSDVHGGRIAAVGESMGGEEAIGAAASDTRIKAVVAEGALWRVPADTAWLAHDPAGLIARATNWLQAQVTGLLSGAPEPAGLRDALAATAPRPVLLIAGRDEIKGDRTYRDATPTNVDLWEMPDTAHTRGLATHPDEWRARVVGFLDAALAPASST